jgi:hypothetical protein
MLPFISVPLAFISGSLPFFRNQRCSRAEDCMIRIKAACAALVISSAGRSKDNFGSLRNSSAVLNRRAKRPQSGATLWPPLSQRTYSWLAPGTTDEDVRRTSISKHVLTATISLLSRLTPVPFLPSQRSHFPLGASVTNRPMILLH